MRAPVYTHDSNPKIDRPLFRKPLSYCSTEVIHGRANWIDTGDQFAGILLFAPEEIMRKAKTERRGSPATHGLLTANESELNADYRGKIQHPDVERQVRQLSSEYEFRLEKHESQGRKGTPRICAVIAAKVKTILSDPVLAR